MATKRNTRRNKRGAMAALSLIALVTMPPHMQPQEQTIPYPEIQYEIPEEPLIFSENEQKVIQFPLIPTIEVNPKLEIYRDLIKEKSEKYGFEADYVARIIWQESRGDSTAVSKAGAIGLVQLMPKNIDRYKVNNPNNPEENLEAGLQHLRWLTDKFGGDHEQGLAAYNVGQRHVIKALKPKSGKLEKIPLYGGKPVNGKTHYNWTWHNYELRTERLPKETRKYIDTIMENE